MKFIIRLLKVLLCVFLFLVVNYVIDERDSLFQSTSYPVEIGEANSNQSNVSLIESPTDEENEFNTFSTHEYENSEVEEDTSHQMDNLHEDSDNSTNDISENNSKKETIHNQTFDYEMEPIDKHSIGHLREMIKIIENYKTTPFNDQTELYDQLYTLNFIHLEEELERKNKPLHLALISLLNSIRDHNNFSDTESVTIILDEISIIVENILQVE